MLQDFHDRGIYLTEDEYRTGLRAIFPENYQHLSDEELEDIIYDSLAQLSPAEVESFMEGFGSWLSRAVRSAAPIITAALPAVATIAGTALGGPVGGMAAGAAANIAAGAINNATRTQPNRFVSNVGGIATAAASGNIRAAIPNIINTTRDVGNAVHRGAGNRIAGIATNIAQAGTSIAGGNYSAAIPNVVNASKSIGNAISPGAGNQVASVASGAAQMLSSYPNANTAPASNSQTASAAQLLSFLGSSPFLQSLLASIITGSAGAGLQIPREDGSTASTNYVEMLEALKQLTDSAIAEADNAGFYSSLPIESEDDKETYIESLIEEVSQYENSLLPNYDVITY